MEEETKSRSWVVRLPERLAARVRAFAKTTKVKPSSATRLALERGIAAYEREWSDTLVDYRKLLAPPPTRRCRVYFIRAGRSGPIKIGVTDGGDRIRGLQTGNAERLRLLVTMAGGTKRERSLHRQFARLRIRGEWFRAEEPLLSYIANLKKRQPQVAQPVTDGKRPKKDGGR